MVAAGDGAAEWIARALLLRARRGRERFYLSRLGEAAWSGSAVLRIAESRARRQGRIAVERCGHGASVCRRRSAYAAARALFSWRILHGWNGCLRDGAAVEREGRAGRNGGAVRYGGLVAGRDVFEVGARRVSGAEAVVSPA